MKVWVAVLAILVLAFLVLRERYENYADALKDVGQTSGYAVPTCEADYTLTADKSTCEKAKDDGTKETKAPTCPRGTHYIFRETEGNCEPDVGENPSEETTEPTCPTDYTFNRDEGACEKKEADGSVKRAAGTCPAGKTINDRGRCIAETPEVLSPTVSRYLRNSGAAPTGTGGTTSSASAVTGGSSGNLIGPTSGGVGPTGKNVWGPVFTGVGESSGGDGGDSTRSNRYPGLLGGMAGRQSAMVPGVGITSPSQPGLGLDMGAMPSLSSMGTDLNARFLPFSRPQADGDPYRLAKGHSTKNYSPQPDPVPFLTDFSAFFK